MGKMRLINLNGEILPADQPVFTAGNRSFRYGDGLFESIRMINGKMPLFKKHLPRLLRGCELLKLELPKDFDDRSIEEEIKKLCEAQGICENARIRLTLFRSIGGFYLPTDSTARFVVEAYPMTDIGFPLNKNGHIVDLYTDIEKPTTKFSTFKTNNALIYVLASIHRKEHGLDDCLLINNKGRVIESIDSNVFLVREGEVHTPPVGEGCVGGVMREYILELMEKKKIICREVSITLEELFNAEEIFLTNAIHGIRWVKKYKVKQYGNTFSSKLSEMLNASLMKDEKQKVC